MSKLLYSTLFFALLIFASCNKDQDDFEPNINESSLANLFAEIQDFGETVSFDSDQAFDIVTENRTIISIPGGILADENGSQITGLVDVEYIEILDKSLMAIYGLETESDNKLLETNFNYYLRFTQNGQEVFIEPGSKVIFRVPYEEAAIDYYRFYGETDSDLIEWNLDGDYNGGNINAEVINYTDWEYDDISGQNWSDFGYQFTVDNVGWMGISSYYGNDALENTSICIDVPQQLGGSLTKAYVIFNNLNSVQELKLDSENSLFCESLGLTPANEEVTVVTISALENDNYYLGMKNIIAGEQEIIAISPTKRSKEEILDILGML